MTDLRDTNLRHAACGHRLTYVGPVQVRALGQKATLCRCPNCDRLVAVYCGSPLWEVAIPEADVPASPMLHGACETAPTDGNT